MSYISQDTQPTGSAESLVPVHRALIEPILLAGAPRGFAILSGTVAAAVGIGLRLWLFGLVIGILGHMLGVWIGKRDPDALTVAQQHLKLPVFFDV
jgi:type IV secretion system protein TrbD